MAKFTVQCNKGFNNTIIADFEPQDLQSAESLQQVMAMQMRLMELYDQANPRVENNTSAPKGNYGKGSSYPKQQAVATCPKCGGDIVKRSGAHGEFYSCNNYKQCGLTPKEANEVVKQQSQPQPQFQQVNQGQAVPQQPTQQTPPAPVAQQQALPPLPQAPNSNELPF